MKAPRQCGCIVLKSTGTAEMRVPQILWHARSFGLTPPHRAAPFVRIPATAFAVFSVEVVSAVMLFTPYKLFASVVLFGMMSAIALTHVSALLFCLVRLHPTTSPHPTADPLRPTPTKRI